ANANLGDAFHFSNLWSALVAATVLIGGFTVIAGLVPAWRATQVSPMIAIRNDTEGMSRETRVASLVAGRVSELVTRESNSSAAENALLAAIADGSRQADSFSNAIQMALET